MIDVQVRTESGDIVVHGSCGLDWKAVGRIDEDEFPFLGSLLPYADTMFNSRQTERLRREIADQSVSQILGRDAVAEIERLCLQVKNGPHLYLWFLGD
ncbi:hypothetical protein GCM10010149_76050 [Nonomuraea roseoviolacea subsp. roseoviolacea]|uniref:Uncharacterized protein n=1 Tax=Nonomuraea roseoviolacea subsp. carminata TaxID=160689 RepID=A0ABT1KDK0_9ACTN|nr:hypothetical protein [Nonomuraea roseoviolacea]MCP2351684.1 hypothetical protein [Nonomuraea roseoviolacea subsp. carminata]